MERIDKNRLRNPPKKYRPIPFWSWNEKLDISETKRQIRIMHEAGLGGYFMHARGGLQTDYMGKEWFDNVKIGIDEGKSLGISAWAYDENGWPSGFGDGIVTELGEEYQQKYLKMERGEKETPHTVYNMDGIHFYYEINPSYTDNLNKKAVKRFIDEIYAPYYDRFGSRLSGFFTDEPQLPYNAIPWSSSLPGEYYNEYGEDLLPRLIHLFRADGDYKRTRIRFWRLITKLFSENYFKQIYDWCNERGLCLTGHLVSEQNTLTEGMTQNGSCMPHYEYFHIPGIDWLGRDIIHPLIQLQIASAALQTGKKQIITESFALCGHNVSFSELRRIYEWQMARGVNLLCQHLEGYSLRGIRKRDYPPALYYQQPWWNEYKLFVDSMSRIGMLISEGAPDCTTLLIHPQTSIWICYDTDKNEGLKEYHDKFIETINILEHKHIQFHLGDETLIERHGHVEGNRFIIGNMEYTTVVLPPFINFWEHTKSLLKKFNDNGGKIITAEEATENPVTDNENITYLKRCFDTFDMHYFVNSTSQRQNAHINVSGMKLDIMSGNTVPFPPDYEFNAMDSLVILDYKSLNPDGCENKVLDNISLEGKWDVVSYTENALTLDFCDCYFDNVLVEKNLPVTSVQGRACDLGRPVNIRCVYSFEVDHIPDNLNLICETPHIFEFRINGQEYRFNDAGCFRDISFRKSDITGYIKRGINEIEIICLFTQSQRTYENISKSKLYDTYRNKLTYDMEIEPIYLTGNFSVTTKGEFEHLDKNAIRYKGNFIIDRPKEKVYLKNLEQQGFPFFAGSLTLSKQINCNKASKLTLNMLGLNGVHIKVNGKDADTVIWNHSESDLSAYLKNGENTLELMLVNNLRNLLGPHHLEDGESYHVRPSSFFAEKTIWHRNNIPVSWNENYCFMETSLF